MAVGKQACTLQMLSSLASDHGEWEGHLASLRVGAKLCLGRLRTSGLEHSAFIGVHSCGR